MEIQKLIMTARDIGNPFIKGSTVEMDDGLDIKAGGIDIWSCSDQFHFSFMEHAGNFDFTARIEALSSADLYTKSGLMTRASLESDSQHTYFLTFPNNAPRNNNTGGLEFQYRSIQGGDSKAIYPIINSVFPSFPTNFPNTWLRLVRIGDTFHAYYSKSGLEWNLYCSLKLQLPPVVFLGIAVTSHNELKTASSSIRNISIK
jgi:hypothetical protein